jgi:hypothetical protein
MEERAGGFTDGAATSPGTPAEANLSGTAERIGSEGAAAVGIIECSRESSWSRRTHVTASAGFCAASRSSVMEMAGNNTNKSTASATNCMRRSVTVHGAHRSHRQNIPVASRSQARLSVSSINSNLFYTPVKQPTKRDPRRKSTVSAPRGYEFH